MPESKEETESEGMEVKKPPWAGGRFYSPSCLLTVLEELPTQDSPKCLIHKYMRKIKCLFKTPSLGRDFKQK